MPMKEKTQLLLAKGILGFWVLLWVGLSIFLIWEISSNWSDFWYTFESPIIVLVCLAICYGLLKASEWAYIKVREDHDCCC